MFMPEQHVGKNIAAAIQATLEVWCLQEAHRVCLTSDSGGNVANCVKIFIYIAGRRMNCQKYNLK